MKYVCLLLLFVLSSVSQISLAQKALSDDVIVNIEKRIEYNLNPSIVIGIIDKNGPQYFSFGNKTIGGEAVDEHTIYEIGSISKTFTAIMLADMVNKGMMKLDDPIKMYLPDDVRVPQFNGVDITLGHLSDHTSSLPRMPDNFNPADPANPYADYTEELLFEFLNGVELKREIGSEYEYSNLAQGLLGAILARKAGVSYEQLLASLITKPLGLSETKVTFDDHMKRNLAIGHDQGDEVSNWDIAVLVGAGGIRSSTADMLTYLAANLGLKKTPLSSAMNLTQKERHDKAGNQSVGLGWHIVKADGEEYITHGGATGGYRAFAALNKKRGKAVVVMTNSSKGIEDIGRHLMDPSVELEMPKRDIATVMKKTIDESGIEKAIMKYKDIKAKNVDEYDFNEGSVNMLGYYYMNKADYDTALALFKLNIEEHPHAFNTYDSYAEALMNLSIKNYKKSIELNPNNQNGYDMLAKMGVEEEKEVVVVAADVLTTYVGKYQLAPTFFIEITSSENQLFAQATGQDKFELFPISDSKFFLKVVDAQVEFFHDDNDHVKSLTLYQGGKEMPGEKVD
jgi:CubicO group peptidase (beta-lactamase class C family)